MSKKKTKDSKDIYAESIEMQQFRQLLRDKGYYQPHTPEQKKFTLEAPDRIYRKVLKRAGKYTIATAILLLVLSSWKKVISTLFGKATVIVVTTTVTVTSGYYIKKIILDKTPEKKIEIKEDIRKHPEQKIPVNKPVWHFAFKSLQVIATGVDNRDKTQIEHILYSTLVSQKLKHADQMITVTVNYLENFYSVGIEIYEKPTPVHKRTRYVANSEAKNIAEVFAFYKNQSRIIYQKYVQ